MTVVITVRPGLAGHIAPDRVGQDLPPFVRTLRENGLQVNSITAPITDADSAHVEEILKAASELDIRNHWWGTFRYDANTPVMRDLEEAGI